MHLLGSNRDWLLTLRSGMLNLWLTERLLVRVVAAIILSHVCWQVFSPGAEINQNSVIVTARLPPQRSGSNTSKRCSYLSGDTTYVHTPFRNAVLTIRHQPSQWNDVLEPGDSGISDPRALNTAPSDFLGHLYYLTNLWKRTRRTCLQLTGSEKMVKVRRCPEGIS